jgi:hypothetical protein
VRTPAFSGPSCLLPHIVEALPEWVAADEAAEWSPRELERVVYKPCTSCREWKLRTEFHVMRSMYDGRYPRCKECRRAERLGKLGRLPDD